MQSVLPPERCGFSDFYLVFADAGIIGLPSLSYQCHIFPAFLWALSIPTKLTPGTLQVFVNSSYSILPVFSCHWLPFLQAALQVWRISFGFLCYYLRCCCWFMFCETVSLCSPGWPGTCYVTRLASNVLHTVLLHLPPKCWDCKNVLPCIPRKALL